MARLEEPKVEKSNSELCTCPPDTSALITAAKPIALIESNATVEAALCVTSINSVEWYGVPRRNDVKGESIIY